MAYSSVEEARKRIDQQLVDLEKRFLELKAERNTYAPFANLPGDILLEIFEAAKEDVKFSAWYKIIGVCRQWRTVAIGAPTLWMNPPTDKHEMMLLMLERSREASLGVDISDTSSSSTILALRNHVERIRKLTVCAQAFKRSRLLSSCHSSASHFIRLCETSWRSGSYIMHAATAIEERSRTQSQWARSCPLSFQACARLNVDVATQSFSLNL